MTLPTAPEPLVYVPEEPFRYIGGHPGADLVNTVDWLADGLDRDRLTDFGRVIEWAEQGGIIGAAAATRLRAEAEVRPEEARAALAVARDTRGVLQRLLTAVANGTLTGGDGIAALADFDALLADVVSHLRVAPPRRRSGEEQERPGLRWVWVGADDRLDALLWPVVWSTAQLLTSADAAKLRVCAGHDCGWVYVDRSRNGFRRWCEMATCGTREKSRRRAERRRGAAPA